MALLLNIAGLAGPAVIVGVTPQLWPHTGVNDVFEVHMLKPLLADVALTHTSVICWLVAELGTLVGCPSLGYLANPADWAR